MRRPDDLRKLARDAGYKGTDQTVLANVRRLQNSPKAKAVLDRLLTPTLRKYKVTKDWIIRRTRDIVMDPESSRETRLRALRQLAEMVPGAIAPTNVQVKGNLTLEEFVRLAGGAPEDDAAVKGEAQRMKEAMQ